MGSPSLVFKHRLPVRDDAAVVCTKQGVGLDDLQSSFHLQHSICVCAFPVHEMNYFFTIASTHEPKDDQTERMWRGYQRCKLVQYFFPDNTLLFRLKLFRLISLSDHTLSVFDYTFHYWWSFSEYELFHSQHCLFRKRLLLQHKAASPLWTVLMEFILHITRKTHTMRLILTDFSFTRGKLSRIRFNKHEFFFHYLKIFWNCVERTGCLNS